jgi:phosphoribosylformylglycinamidine synthase subunit PurS
MPGTGKCWKPPWPILIAGLTGLNKLVSRWVGAQPVRKARNGIVHVFGHLLTYNLLYPMKAYVYVSLKKSVLDPQGKTIQGALKKIGYKGLEDVRQGKYFELTLDGGLDRATAEAEVGRIAREVLTNPVIEEFRFSLED